MKKLIILFFVVCSSFSFYNLKSKNQDNIYKVAFVQEKYIDKGSYKYHNDDSTYTKGENSNIRNFIGIFPKANDTVTIYKLNTDKSDKPKIFVFWFKKNKTQSISLFSSGEEIQVTFGNDNNIIVDNDIYNVNKKYYDYLKLKILTEGSALDLAFFLKDGYGDYAQLLEPLNKNWRNQKENNDFKILKAVIKNRDNQTDEQFFNYTINYKYNKTGKLLAISGQNRYNKKYVTANKTYTKYYIENGENERSISNSYYYKNKKTLFDSVVGSTKQYSISKTTYFTKYQSKLVMKNTKQKSNSVDDIIKLLNLKVK